MQQVQQFSGMRAHTVRDGGLLLALHSMIVAVALSYLRNNYLQRNSMNHRLHTLPTAHNMECQKELDIHVNFEIAQLFQCMQNQLDAEHIVLVDASVQSFEDLQCVSDGAQKECSIWQRFQNKCKSQNCELNMEKMLHMQDVGDNDRMLMSVARIPVEMYQKLDLAGTLADIHKSNQVVVHTVSLGGEYITNTAMCDALLSGLQLARYAMPTYKTGKSAVNAEIAPQPLHLTICLPKESFITPFAVAASSGLGELPNDVSDVSALERAMLAASSARYGGDTVATDISDDSKLQQESAVRRLNRTLKIAYLINEGTHLCRSLTCLPPNVLTPSAYNELLHSMAAQHGWLIDEWSAEQLRDVGCGAFWAVGQADSQHPGKAARLVRLSALPTSPITNVGKIGYSSTVNGRADVSLDGVQGSVPGNDYVRTRGLCGQEADRPVVLVGKGVCYDTGDGMRFMKTDMAGSAAALGTFLALTKAGFPHPLECWIALAENNVNSLSYRPDDVLTTVTGTTVEVVHTDAEGRLLLADTLALASRAVLPEIMFPRDGSAALSAPPRLLMDFATLTGSCVTALSDRYIGAFSNRDLAATLIAAGTQCGERIWPFPLDDDFADDLRKSDIADLLQCMPKTAADHIYAAAFLKQFVKPTVPWVHLDLSSAHRPGGLGHVGSDCTGVGVRAGVYLIKAILSKH